MPGRMKRDRDSIARNRFAIRERFNARIRAETFLQNRAAFVRRQIIPRSDSRMVTVRMRDHRVIDPFPRVDIKVARVAIESAWSIPQQSHFAKRGGVRFIGTVKNADESRGVESIM
jgi:hypothetical protein